ncbi:winged helix-turn-helix domain-containing protein [Streptomyces sp. NPDC026092]|uniref:winged helix-turn-helix domain-containing protein n=1 Tax=Streptomyces sp. NPDC026092 TaxID=3154797 RepID=UPI00340D8831
MADSPAVSCRSELLSPAPECRSRNRQIADALRRDIDNDVYTPGSHLPSEADLCTRFDASRNTVRSGLALLVSEALVSSSHTGGAL